MEVLKDSKGNTYVDVENIRITYVENKNRQSNTDWAETDVIRFQAYKGHDNNALHMGAEIPIERTIQILDLMEALIKIFRERNRS